MSIALLDNRGAAARRLADACYDRESSQVWNEVGCLGARQNCITSFYNKSGGRGTFGFYFCGDPKGALNVFANGYRKAAETLTRSLLRRRGFSKFEAYPVIFLYRHAFELSLKHAIYKATENPEIDDADNFNSSLTRHRLVPLAENIENLLARLFPGDDVLLQKLLPQIVATAHEFYEIDESSFVSRYPINKKGQPASNKSEFVNLRSFAHHMSSLLEDIDTLNVHLGNEFL